MSNFRPRSAAEIADAAIALLRRHFPQLLPLSAVLVIPSVVLGVFSARVQSGGAASPAAAALLVTLTFVTSLWWFLGSGALVRLASAAYLGEPVDPAESVRVAMARAGRLIGANVLALVVTMLPVMVIGIGMAILIPAMASNTRTAGGAGWAVLLVALLMIAGMVWGARLFTRYVVVTPIVMLEEVRVTRAIERARSLGEGFIGRNFGVLIVAGVLYMAAYLTALGLLGAVVPSEAASGLANIVLVPLYPAWACLVTVLYYDLRIRKEGFDIELMARSIEGAAPSLDVDPPAVSPVA